MDLNRRDPSFRRYNGHMSEQNRKTARLIERLWAAAYAILKSGASQFRISGIDPPPLRTLDLWISGPLAGQDVLPSQGSRITIEPGEHTAGARQPRQKRKK
jgi:hypothetical protein